MLEFIIILVVLPLTLVTLNVHLINKEAHKQASALARRSSNITTFNDLRNYADTLPDTAFRSNLYIIMAADYMADSEKLNNVLQEYARLATDKLVRDSLPPKGTNLQ